MTARERFKSWVEEHDKRGLARWQIAALVRCSESSITRILSGERNASGPIAAKIERATEGWDGGPIRAAEWYPEEPASEDAA